MVTTSESETTLEKLENGELKRYVESRVFDNVIDSLSAIVQRKKAISDENRYIILYLLYETDILGRKTISGLTGLEEEGLEHHLRELRNANLIARVHTPDGLDGRHTYYRITALGRDEIESDLTSIHSQYMAKKFAGSQRSFSELDQFMADIDQPYTLDKLDDPNWLTSKRESLRDKANNLIIENEGVEK